MSDGVPAVPAVSRRAVLHGAVAGAGGIVGAAGVLAAGAFTGDGALTGTGTGTGAGSAADPGEPEPFYGRHQQGIISRPLPFVAIGGFNLKTQRVSEVRALLLAWTKAAAALATPAIPAARDSPRVTFTFGFGPSFFDAAGLGLGARRPTALVDLPQFAGDAIDPAASHGDLCVQVCGSAPAAAADGLRTMINVGRSAVGLRWRQVGFRNVDATADATADPRGQFGFRDGSRNLNLSDSAATSEFLWVSDGPQWLHNGTYLVVRRIRLIIDTWDRVPLADQEAMIGRRRESNRRLTAAELLPGAGRSHVELASAEDNAGTTLLRRSYSYDAGVDGNGLQDSGMIFLAFQRDPGRQFVTIQRRLAAFDRLNGFSQHLTTGVFACPPGIARGSFAGAELFA